MKKPPSFLVVLAILLSECLSAQPGNDNCANAYLLSTGSTCLSAQGTLKSATVAAPAGVCTGTPDDDVWFKFVASATNPTITVSTIGTNIIGAGAAQGKGAIIQLLSGACGSQANVACINGTTDPLSLTTAGLTIGTTYYVRVYSKNNVALTTNCSFDICVINPTAPIIDSTSALFYMDTVAKNLGFPWEITYGPDDSLWITEARGYRVVRISSTRNASQENVPVQQILKLPLGSNGNPGPTFDRTIGTWPQGGMEGLAIHPEFKTDSMKQWVYIAYVYAGTCASSPPSACIFRSKIVRCRFYYAANAGNPSSLPKKDTLVIMDTVISNLSGSNDHNSGRLKISPVKEINPGVDTTYKLYYTIGDMGAGQFNNASRTNNAQSKDTCEGKILRLNTEPDGDGSFGITHDFNTWRQWIPNDNPFTHSVNGLRTPVYSYGHRNAQGIAWGNVGGTWRLYSSEHGDMSDDEVNIIVSGKNYGWPKVAGLADNNYNTSDNPTDGFIRNDILANLTVNDETTFAGSTPNFTPPIFTFFSWSNAQIETLNTGNIFTWPTVAPSSIDFYNGNIPGWKNSLLVTSLKYGLFRLKLQSTGDLIDSTVSSVVIDTFPILHSWRVRDIAINPLPNSGKFWVIIDSTGSTSGPTGGFTGGNNATKSGGKVLMLTYKGSLTLPVHFITFTGRLLPDKTIRLNWSAETDVNHDHFEVEKSSSIYSFVSIGWITGGNSPYSLIDASPFIGNNYYRIKQVDKNGKTTYSKVINIVYDPSVFMMTIYPNPVRDLLSLKVSMAKADNIQVQVSDMQGHIIFNQVRFIQNGIGEIQINTKSWSSQLYLVKIINSENKVVAGQKFIKL